MLFGKREVEKKARGRSCGPECVPMDECTKIMADMDRRVKEGKGDRETMLRELLEKRIRMKKMERAEAGLGKELAEKAAGV